MKRKSLELGGSERRLRDDCSGERLVLGFPDHTWPSSSDGNVASTSAAEKTSAADEEPAQNRQQQEQLCLDLALTDTHRQLSQQQQQQEVADSYEQVGDVTLREWLSRPGRVVDRVTCLHIFKQVLELVELAQKQGVILRTIRPSCFVISPLHRITFIESGSSSDRSSEHSTGRASDGVEQDLGLVIPHQQQQQQGQLVVRTVADPTSSSSGYQKADGEDQWTSSFGPSEPSSREVDENFPLKQVLAKEQTWYTSPEELAGGTSSFASDVYSLGVLFFELYSTFSSNMEWSRAMSDLRHRILPPRLLSESPKEAALCLWLLHPEPQSRPKAREIFQCELFSEAGEALAEREAAANIEEKEADSALLLDFLLLVQQEKQEAAEKLSQDVDGLSMDIMEVEKRRAVLKQKGVAANHHPERDRVWNFGGGRDESFGSSSRNRLDLSLRTAEEDENQNQVALPVARQGEVRSRSARLMRNFSQLEQAYFSMRWKAQADMDKERGAGESSSKAGRGSSDRLGSFFDSLCKYARYSRFEVKATLRHGDLLNTANMVCSLSFDRDEEFFATAGVCKKIKVFECDTVLNEHVDIHYPVVEMASRSKLSSICWNSYIKSHLASSDYDGVIQLWDASTSQVLVEYKEHEKRAWSVDFSHADPTKLASGSDDGSVKIWSINQESSIGSIRVKANVCCVQFPSDSAQLLALGSADYKIYCYDLRNTRAPLFVLASHNKAVSYVRFLDSTTLVSASTDSTLKLWDLTSPLRNGNTTNACCLTYSGHTNEKNFVGLSVADGYIACGSETNTVFCYHKSLPMPVASHKFGWADPVSGQENEEDGGQFVSSVCWRGKSQTLLAANSMGNIKVLELV